MRRSWSVVALGAAVALVPAACASEPGGDAEPTTTWEAYEDLNAYLLETAEAVGIEDAEQATGGAEVFECSRLLRADGEGFQLELAKVEGPVAGDGTDILSAVADHWAADGYEVASSAGQVRAGNPDDGELQAFQIPNGGNLVLTGVTPCMDEAGTPPE